jgi:hypothetical protein
MTRLEVCIDCAQPLTLARFWQGLLGGGPIRGNGEPYCDVVLPDGLPVLTFQRVPEAKTAKNRLHLDLFVADPAAEIERARGLGASLVGAPVDTGRSWWQVMADPEGNEFCVCQDYVEGG